MTSIAEPAVHHHREHRRDPHPEINERHRHRGADEKREVASMQLSALLDRKVQAEADGPGIPCRDYDAELWFAESPADVEFAKSLCTGCPALAACLAGALDRHEPWGVWGGQLFVQGVVVARKRPRGRPRKNDVAA
jgi:WhiB family redox-sensing transcriptional regulator